MISTCNICKDIFEVSELVDVGFTMGYECEPCNDSGVEN
jgi:hypothetical protein